MINIVKINWLGLWVETCPDDLPLSVNIEIQQELEEIQGLLADGGI